MCETKHATANGKHWADDIFLVFDTETTGLDVRTDRIVQAAVLFVSPDGSVLESSYETIVDAGISVPAVAVAVHGITTERMRRDGVRQAVVCRETLDRFELARASGYGVVIYNARYDWPLLAAHATREFTPLPNNALLLDPWCLDRTLDPYRPGGRRLEQVAQHYGVPTTAAHSARADALAAVAIMRALLGVHPELCEHSLSELHRKQAECFEEWKHSLNSYLSRKGRGDLITGSWPGG